MLYAIQHTHGVSTRGVHRPLIGQLHTFDTLVDLESWLNLGNPVFSQPGARTRLNPTLPIHKTFIDIYICDTGHSIHHHV